MVPVSSLREKKRGPYAALRSMSAAEEADLPKEVRQA